MNYCGIDLGGMSSYAYVTNEAGGKLWSGPLETMKSAFERFVERFLPEGLAIAIEAGNQTAWVHEELVKLAQGGRGESEPGEAHCRESSQDRQSRRQDPLRIATTWRTASPSTHAGALSQGTARSWSRDASSSQRVPSSAMWSVACSGKQVSI